MRSEQFERITCRLQIDLDAGIVQHGYSSRKPWDGVFAAAVKDKEFCLLYTPHAADALLFVYLCGRRII